MIIVTGGAGFIGSNFVKTLSEISRSPIVVCDDFGDGDKWQNLKNHLIHDIIAPTELFAYLDQHLEEVSMIVHMGGVSSTTERNVDLIIDNNFKFSKDLYDWCTECNKRFIYASDASTYGRGDQGFHDGDDPDILRRLKPLNGYAWSKHAFDRFVADQKTQGKAQPPQCVGLKFFNVYGPNEYHKGTHTSVAHQIYHQVAANAAAKLYKSDDDAYNHGDQKRDFIFIEDCCRVLKWLYESPSVSGLFNVGSGQARSFNDLANAIFKALQKEPNIDYVDMPDTLVERYQYHTEADLTNLRRAGYDAPFTSLEDGVQEYVTAYLTKEDPYR